MKSQNLLVSIALFVALALGGVATAQDAYPSEQLGFGASVGTGYKIGGHVVYALDTKMYLGTELGFQFKHDTETKTSVTNVHFAPFFKYMMDPLKDNGAFRPGIMANFVISSIGRVEQDLIDQDQYNTTTATTTSLNIYGGGEWFPYKQVGVFAAIRVIGFQMSPTVFTAGVGDAYVGIEWFLD